MCVCDHIKSFDSNRYKQMLIPTLILFLFSVLEQKLVTCEMKCLRKAVNKTRRDKIRNEVIRDMVGATPVLHHIEQQRTKWFGHLTRMPPNQPALRAYNLRYSGTRARGRPRRRWSDSVAETLKFHGLSLLQATRLAADRQLYLPATPQSTSGRKKKRKKEERMLRLSSLLTSSHGFSTKVERKLSCN